MKTSLMNKCKLTVKQTIFKYLYKPDTFMPSAKNLDDTFKSIYKKTQTGYIKHYRCINSNNNSHNSSLSSSHKKTMRIRSLAKLIERQNDSIARQHKYEELFCSPSWNTKNWEVFKFIPKKCRFIVHKRENSRNKTTLLKHLINKTCSKLENESTMNGSNIDESYSNHNLYSMENNFLYSWNATKLHKRKLILKQKILKSIK